MRRSMVPPFRVKPVPVVSTKTFVLARLAAVSAAPWMTWPAASV